LFEQAFELASEAGLEHLAIDSLHMVAIVAPADGQAALNEQALAMASAAIDPRAREWRASLLNNLGWTRFDGGDYAAALALFEDAVTERERLGKARELQIARWCVGRTLRALGRTEGALELQVSLADKSSRTWVSDSFVEEEIGECLVDLGRPAEARAHFAEAAKLLEAAGAGEQADPERLARLQAAGSAADAAGATRATGVDHDQTSTTPDPGSD
jgi:tetratricopeptide (TPR) repeat protein